MPPHTPRLRVVPSSVGTSGIGIGIGISISSVGILGTGRVGSALAALARNAGFDVVTANSSNAKGIADAAQADIVIAAIPLGKYRTLPADALAGRLVIDAMNYWWELDGRLPEFEDARTSSSEVVAASLPGARIVKTFNHASVWELQNLAAPAGDPERRALAMAGDDAEAVAAASQLVDTMGFDPVPAGGLAEGVRFEPNTEAFGSDSTAGELQEMLDDFWQSQRGLVVARARGGAKA
jgi:predicted dinucleotide-binding enzyme